MIMRSQTENIMRMPESLVIFWEYVNSHFSSNTRMYEYVHLYAVKTSEGSKVSCKTNSSMSQKNHISPLLMSLHWLPINARIEYKLSVICHSFFLDLSPTYLSDLLSVYTPKRKLRSSYDNIILCIHKLRTKIFGHRSFIFAAPTIWIFFAFRAQTY